MNMTLSEHIAGRTKESLDGNMMQKITSSVSYELCLYLKLYILIEIVVKVNIFLRMFML